MIQEVNAVEKSPIISNGEDFTEGEYNGIKVLKRKSDGFINATKMCNQFGKNFRKIFQNDSFHEYFEEFSLEYAKNTTRQDYGGFIYELGKGYAKAVAGTYVDKRMINYIAIWASPKYAVKVGIIMDALDEKNQLTNQTLEDTIKQLQSELNELRIKNQQQAEVITEQTSTIEEQKVDIFENHNRANEYNNNFLYIVSDPENKEYFKISVNQTNPPKVWQVWFSFPSSFNIKKQIGDKLKEMLGKGYKKHVARFHQSQMPSVADAICEFKPKNGCMKKKFKELYDNLKNEC